jgi:4-amino-4-deoxy-L-arabinose transferase-like glycosyltransferase
VALRLPSTLSAAATVALTGVLAADLGARRSGQVFAAACAGLSGVVLATGHLLSTATTMLFGSALLSLLVVRLLQGGPARGWLLVGLAVGVTSMANVLVAVLFAVLLCCILLVGPRQLLRSPWPWAGGLVALALVAPYLWWQASHGWPQADIARSIAAGGSGTSAPRLLFLPLQLVLVGPFLTVVWVSGLVQLSRDRHLRGLAFAYPVLCVLFIATGGKPYYVAGLYPLLLAAGAQPVIDHTRGWLPPVLLLASAPVLFITLPLLPARDANPIIAANYDAGETIGWPSYVAQIARVYRGQPAGTQLLTQNYGEAGAIDRYGPALGLPRSYSGHNGYGLWGPPPGDTTSVVAVGVSPATLHAAFNEVRAVGRLDNGLGINNDEQGTTVYACTGPRDSWPRLWPLFVHLG